MDVVERIPSVVEQAAAAGSRRDAGAGPALVERHRYSGPPNRASVVVGIGSCGSHDVRFERWVDEYVFDKRPTVSLRVLQRYMDCRARREAIYRLRDTFRSAAGTRGAYDPNDRGTPPVMPTGRGYAAKPGSLGEGGGRRPRGGLR